MTLNILFMSVTIKKQNRSAEEYEHDYMVSRHYQENKLKQETIRMY
ncbi:YrzI family small protein [Rossellomorea vietnamensis]|uniref:YrzI family small protein n=1 Tax=Rossellomorea vietnamensis TaxID=218284 RepID=A0A5D4MG35_9BACI|nr:MULTISPECIES: YrzI family small protein [Bacillaceae]TYS00835.1 YrzI family small protein [Rossellomorea vietnamensis]